MHAVCFVCLSVCLSVPAPGWIPVVEPVHLGLLLRPVCSSGLLFDCPPWLFLFHLV